MSGTLQLHRDGHVATIVIDNPGKKNAMNQAMWIAMGDMLHDLKRDPGLRCLVLRGAGDSAFGSGADIEEFEAIRATREQAIAFAQHGHRAMHGVRDFPVPTVAAIRGACVGGGLELAAFCDIRLCTSDSRFGVPIARLGAVLAYPELEGLVRVAGPDGALRLLLLGDVVSADEALRMGLVQQVVETADFDEALGQAVSRILAGAPLSARWHKKFVQRLRDGTPLTPQERDEGYDCFDTEDYHRGFQAFLAKTKPEYLGR
ncbi:enoyl-CoA hydratase [Bordetella ansorpii]|uniref:Enoyl-CoA hydratase n=1 Tax=Bordetella ansorpii TaxID=288768 RepID=A0A157LSY1_9BORD|nr:enoyl-CoA hydratase-related protein [Bordetella ansorpii]SAH99489.1 enoyl-CoA hydratase [Bordetella ansorpii]